MIITCALKHVEIASVIRIIGISTEENFTFLWLAAVS